MAKRRDGRWNPPGLCVHCGQRQIGRPRRLCWSCWKTPEIRELYPPMPPTESGSIGGRSRIDTWRQTHVKKTRQELRAIAKEKSLRVKALMAAIPANKQIG